MFVWDYNNENFLKNNRNERKKKSRNDKKQKDGKKKLADILHC
jgi:hypothetical protein